jgi:hypothetical protein
MWFQVYNSFDKTKNKLIPKLICNRREKYLHEIPPEEREKCTDLKTYKDLKGCWKYD